MSVYYWLLTPHSLLLAPCYSLLTTYCLRRFVYLMFVSVFAQVRREHAMLEALLLEDVIAAAPTFLQPPLMLSHSEVPFTNVRSLRERAVAIKKNAVERAEHLWQDHC